MRALPTELAHLFFSIPLYLVLCLASIAIRGYRNARPWRHGAALLCLGAYVLTIPATSNALVARIEAQWPVPAFEALEKTFERREPQILALTAGWYRDTESGQVPMLGERGWERLLAAVELHRRVGGTLIFSGAPMPDGSGSVAESMAQAAVQMGVPAQRVRTETRSLNTRENLLYTERELRLRALAPVVLVTSALHMSRAVAAARSVDLEVLAYPCGFRATRGFNWKSFVPSNDAARAFEDAMHELLGLAAHVARERT